MVGCSRNAREGDEFGELAEAFNTMAKELKDYNSSNLAEIMSQKRRIDAIIHSLHVPILGLYEMMNILFAMPLQLGFSE